MSKKRRRHRRDREETSNIQGEINNNLPFGINPNQLLSLLGENLDQNKLGDIISSMKNNGVDLNNFNLNSSGSSERGNSDLNNNNNNNNNGGYEFGGLQGLMNALGMNSFNMQNNNLNNNSNNSNLNNNFADLGEESNFEDNFTNDEEGGFKERVEEDYSGEGVEKENDIIEEDENIQMLISIKSIVDDRKADFIDRIIEAYRKGLF